jgi:hypothetical protein
MRPFAKIQPLGLLAFFLGFIAFHTAAATIYVLSCGTGTVGEYTTSGITVNASLISGLGNPFALALAGTNLFLGSYTTETVNEYSTSGATVASPLISGLDEPYNLAISGSNVFVANFFTGTVGEYTTSGATVNASLISGLNQPTDIAISGTNLFVVNYGNNTVGEYTTSGATVNASLISGLNGPIGIAISGTNLYVGNYGNNTVGDYTTSGATVNPSLLSGLNQPAEIAVSGPDLFVVNYGNNTVGEYTTFGATINASLISGLSQPRGIAIDSGTERTFYVDINSPNPTPPYTNWATASTDIQSALNQTTNGDLVLVNPGTYQTGGETVNGYGLTNRVVISDSITVESAQGPATTIIQGNSPVGSNAVRCVYMTNGSALFGFTLTNGATLSSGDLFEEQSGGGIFCWSTSVLVSNCVIAGNSACGGGFETGGGGGAVNGTFYNCQIISNQVTDGSGGGVCQGICVNCFFTSNNATEFGGAADYSTLDNCILTNNFATVSAGGAYTSSLTNCLIIANSCSWYITVGGVGNCTVNNCTILYNSTPGGSGGVSGSSVYNSIICYNTSSGSPANYDSQSTLNYCCTTPTPASGVNNITNAPQFISVMGNFRLQTNSPCINEGDNAYVILTNDLDGDPRVVGGTVDMGAYEYQTPIPLALSVTPNFTNVAPGFPDGLQAVIGQGYATGILWNFSDGTTATNLLTLSHSWSSPGVYTVTLTVSNNLVPEATIASFTVNVLTQLDFYVNANGTNPVPPYSSWGTAATNIQDAVNVAPNGGIVLVTNGVYQSGGYTAPDGTLCAVVLTNAINLQSVNGPSSTFINGSNAMRCVYLANGSSLVGFTITNGLVNGNGGGVYCQSASCVVSNCVITGNSVDQCGGGDYQGTLLNCDLINNQSWNFESTGGGGACQATLVNCIIFNNFAYFYGGGAANCFIYQSLIVSNLVYNYSQSEGGGTYDCTNFSSAIAENYASAFGGGAYGGILVNCTVTENTAGFGYGGGTYSSIQTNCIIYYNQGYDDYSNYYEGTFSYCCTVPSPGYPGNISTPPVLASISHISLNSPCRSAGNPKATYGVDIDGNPWASPPSIGCSEPNTMGNYFGNLAVGISVPFTNWAPGFPINIQANLTGPVYNSVWNFGDGTLVTNQAYTSHTWAASGTYPVTLTAYNDSYPTGIVATQMMTIAVPTVYYVTANSLNPTPPYSYWSIAATNIQNAISVAAPGSQVLVQQSTNMFLYGGRVTYYTNLPNIFQWPGSGISGPDGYSYSLAITNPITVQSVGGPHNMWIEPPPDNYGCIYMSNGVVLSGFTITNAPGSHYGPGVLCASTNDLITNCVIADAGGITSGTLYNCLITNSGANGSTMYNCWISRGLATGSTMYNCIITNGVGVDGGGVMGGILNNCLIVSNNATYGGGVYASAAYPVVLNNCIISNNTAVAGGGVYNNWPTPGGYVTNCILNNCTVTHNSATGGPSSGYGGGAFYAQLNNCLVSSNKAVYGGGVEGGLLNNCTLIGNYAGYGSGGGADKNDNNYPYGSQAIGVLSNCLLVGNLAEYGGGAYGCVLNQCTLLQNTNNFNGSGGGAYLCLLDNCLVISNSAGSSFTSAGGGAEYCHVTNTIFAYNTATNGGGAYGSILVNCTVTGNVSTNGSGVYDCTNYNSIIYYNSGGDYFPSTSQYPLNYCCTALMPTNGFRNITLAPLFVNAASGNYQLQANSPCINSGNSAYISVPTDLAGNPRIVGGTVDIGAYEYQTPTSVLSYAYLQQYGLPMDGSVDFADLDGTAFNVYQDWVAGLNPTNSASVLAMLTPKATLNTNGITVTWQSVSGIPYLLQRSTNLPSFITIQSITGLSGTTSYQDTSATNNVPYLYRVGVLVP